MKINGRKPNASGRFYKKQFVSKIGPDCKSPPKFNEIYYLETEDSQ